MFRSERGRYRGQQVVLTGLIPWLLFISMSALAEGTLTDNLRIRSKVLGYDLQYRVYLPQAGQDAGPYPALFMTDGQNYLGRGHMDQVLDRETGKGSIRPVIAVFVDPRDPDDPETNRRRQQFLCNSEYFQFYVEELIPAIEASYPVIRDRTGRTIMGVSFGGTNAACFGALGSETFSGLVMQKPLALGADLVMHSLTKYVGGVLGSATGHQVRSSTFPALAGSSHSRCVVAMSFCAAAGRAARREPRRSRSSSPKMSSSRSTGGVEKWRSKRCAEPSRSARARVRC